MQRFRSKFLSSGGARERASVAYSILSCSYLMSSFRLGLARLELHAYDDHCFSRSAGRASVSRLAQVQDDDEEAQLLPQRRQFYASFPMARMQKCAPCGVRQTSIAARRRRRRMTIRGAWWTKLALAPPTHRNQEPAPIARHSLASHNNDRPSGMVAPRGPSTAFPRPDTH